MNRRRVIRRAAAGLALALCASACAAPRAALGTAASPCFRALASAKTAVHGNGRLVGAHHVTGGTVDRTYPGVVSPRPRHACLVGFSGGFRSDSVDLPNGAASGRYAVVVVTTHQWRALATVVTDRLPHGLRHR